MDLRPLLYNQQRKSCVHPPKRCHQGEDFRNPDLLLLQKSVTSLIALIARIACEDFQQLGRNLRRSSVHAQGEQWQGAAGTHGLQENVKEAMQLQASEQNVCSVHSRGRWESQT